MTLALVGCFQTLNFTFHCILASSTGYWCSHSINKTQ